jgi:hypothetical protein
VFRGPVRKRYFNSYLKISLTRCVPRVQNCSFLEALSHLKPHETFLITFTLVLGFLSILKLLVVLVVLVKRSHQYANEVEGGGYPGAEFRNRRERERLPGYEEVANGEEEAEKREKEEK